MTITVSDLSELDKILLSIAVVDEEELTVEDAKAIRKEAIRGLRMLGYEDETFDILGIAGYGEA